eukprot:TRINITY_DN16478_c0_g1_i2.p2 TRINITY_DN16478_c0_g1~~TRINITY_DN16478_c0_g1_i2.p2  ORF type:complete len:229 (-),score=12.58 TRINITY_DN16478_c0_g1_i2:633-1319(-)
MSCCRIKGLRVIALFELLLALAMIPVDLLESFTGNLAAYSVYHAQKATSPGGCVLYICICLASLFVTSVFFLQRLQNGFPFYYKSDHFENFKLGIRVVGVLFRLIAMNFVFSKYKRYKARAFKIYAPFDGEEDSAMSSRIEHSPKGSPRVNRPVGKILVEEDVGKPAEDNGTEILFRLDVDGNHASKELDSSNWQNGNSTFQSVLHKISYLFLVSAKLLIYHSPSQCE